jgi:hypothetical protein
MVLAAAGNLLFFVKGVAGNAEIVPVRLFYFSNKLVDFSGTRYQWSTLKVVRHFISKSNIAKSF